MLVEKRQEKPRLVDVSLWEHQKEALSYSYNRSSYAYFMEVGTGKTATTIADFLRTCNTIKRVPKTLILCPLIVCENWKREFRTWSPHSVSSQVEILKGSQAKRIKTLITAEKQIFITNVEALIMHDLVRHMKHFGFEALIIDESHKFKNPRAKRTQVLHQLADKMHWKRILSGTPILKTTADIWGQLRILGPKILDESYYRFQKQFFYDKNEWMKTDPKRKALYFPDWRPREDKQHELESIIAFNSYQCRKQDVLTNLPPLVKEIVNVDFSPEQKRCYAQLLTTLEAVVNSKECTTSNALERLLRLQQICSGIFKTDDGETLDLACAKYDALKELLTDITSNGHKVIVWTNWVHTYSRIQKVCDALNLKHVSIYGGQKPEKRQMCVDEFNTDDSVKVCIANPAAGGVGIGLQAASYMIYFSKGYNLEHELQSEARAHRGGSEIHSKITRIDILTNNSIEEDIHEALANKLSVSDFIWSLKNANS